MEIALNTCVCGHSIEEHPNGGACEGGGYLFRGIVEQCLCIGYEAEYNDHEHGGEG